jgi:hypothetical protein
MVVRFALGALLFIALPAASQGGVGYRDAIEQAMRCVHAAMTDVLLPVGVMPEQLANAALARCVDEIEGAAAGAVAGSKAPSGPLEVARVALRRELYEYALQVAGRAHGDSGDAQRLQAAAPPRDEAYLSQATAISSSATWLPPSP